MRDDLAFFIVNKIHIPYLHLNALTVGEVYLTQGNQQLLTEDPGMSTKYVPPQTTMGK